MNRKIQSIKGTHDYLPSDVIMWQYVENILKKTLHSYCYNEIRFPIIENTLLFNRGIGNITDILEKEMYSFQDKKKNNITLRPEGTLGCMRACMNNGMLRNQEHKLWYLGPMFRYEQPQYGRYRQFHQLGIEVLGLKDPEIDLELILLINNIFRQLGITNFIELEINSIGSYESRINYQQLLFKYFKQYEKELSLDCKRRLYTNPFRILDSKDKNIEHIVKNSPLFIDYLDNESLSHFKTLCQFMNNLNISYKINPRLVRGLDYYNRTVFEWKTNKLGSQNTICAGGRYDNLAKFLGAKFTPAIGCAIGIERLILLMDELNIQSIKKIYVDINLILLEKNIFINVIQLSEKIRLALPNNKLRVDILRGNLKKQLSKANKLKSRVVLLIGSKEIKDNTIIIKDLKLRIQKTVLLKNLISELKLIFSIT